jgi:hypothetical protein
MSERCEATLGNGQVDRLGKVQRNGGGIAEIYGCAELLLDFCFREISQRGGIEQASRGVVDDWNQFEIESIDFQTFVFRMDVGDLVRLLRVAWYKIDSLFGDHCAARRYMHLPCIDLSLFSSFSGSRGENREGIRVISNRARTYRHATHILRLHRHGMQRTTRPGLPRGRHLPPPLFAGEWQQP